MDESVETCTQPRTASHESVVHGTPSSQEGEGPSSQVEPSGFGGAEQAPVAGLQVPASWHESSGVQTTGVVPTQTPA